MRVVVRALVRVVAVAQVATRKIRLRVARMLARRFHHGAVVAVVVAVAKRIERIGVCRELRALKYACY